jgi:hypothetical protein
MRGEDVATAVEKVKFLEKFVCLDVEYNVPYITLSSTCPFCGKKAEFEAIESYVSPLKNIRLCSRAYSHGFLKEERVVLYKRLLYDGAIANS